MGSNKHDFCGYATRFDLKCGDGRTIRHGAFDQDNGKTVPLVWHHRGVEDPDNVIGHALLESRKDGMYAYADLNNNPRALSVREAIRHGDINALSIYANRIKQRGSDVVHGVIREVSVVLAGANPGAYIEQVAIEHSDGNVEQLDDAVLIYGGCDLDMEDTVIHAEDEDSDKEKDSEDGETIRDVFETLTEKQKKVVYALVGAALEDKNKSGSDAEHADMENDKENKENEADGETVQDVFDTLTEKQKNVVYAIVGQALKNAKDGTETKTNVEHSEMEENKNMYVKHNVFDQNGDDSFTSSAIISHSDWKEIVNDAKACGSLKTAFLAHADDVTNGVAGKTYGIGNLDLMFPEYKDVRANPDVVKVDDAWVAGVIGGVDKTPFARIKTTTIDITGDIARARGYKKGHLKKEEVIKMARRKTGPTTIYKKQKMDRDDLVDLEGSGFDAVAFLKAEMQSKLREELARAILIGDGRAEDDEDKIDETCIRPILHEDEFYMYKVDVDMTGDTDDDIYTKLIDEIPLAMLDYKGTGSPTLYMGKRHHTKMRMIKDKLGHKLYATEADLAGTLNVNNIVDVPYFDNLYDEDGNEILGIIVNLKDYTVGTNRGGQTNFFDDFDIDYNQYKYLYETRLSGALTRPDCAIVLRSVAKPPVRVSYEIPRDGDTFQNLGDTTATEIQDEITYTEANGFGGTLHYVSSWPEFSNDVKLQSGHFLGVKMENVGSDSSAKIYVQLTGGTDSKMKELGEDHELVMRIVDEQRQKLKVKTVDSKGKTSVRLINLAGLYLEPKVELK